MWGSRRHHGKNKLQVCPSFVNGRRTLWKEMDGIDHRRILRNTDFRKTTYGTWGPNNWIPLKLHYLCAHRNLGVFMYLHKYRYLGLKTTVVGLSLIPMTSTTTCLNADNCQTYVRSAHTPEIQNHLPTNLLAILTHQHFLNLSTCLYLPLPLPKKATVLSWLDAVLTSSLTHLPASGLISFPPILHTIPRTV